MACASDVQGFNSDVTPTRRASQYLIDTCTDRVALADSLHRKHLLAARSIYDIDLAKAEKELGEYFRDIARDTAFRKFEDAVQKASHRRLHFRMKIDEDCMGVIDIHD